MDLLTEPAEYVFVGNEIWRIAVLIIIIALALFFGKISKFFLVAILDLDNLTTMVRN